MERPPTLKDKFNEAFSSESLSDSFMADLEMQLLRHGLESPHSELLTSASERSATPIKRLFDAVPHLPKGTSGSKLAWAFGGIGWGIAASFIVFFISGNFFSRSGRPLAQRNVESATSDAPSEEFDPERGFVSDAGALHYTHLFPADFDTEGEAERLRPYVKEVFGEQNPDFDPGLPGHILASFRPGAGRFLTWHGYPGVSVELEPRALSEVEPNSVASKESSSAKAILFIIHEPERGRIFGTHSAIGSSASIARSESLKQDSSRFINVPAQPRNFGKRQIKGLWREGGVTYLLLDAPAVSE